MHQLHILRVFTAEDGSGGNPLGVFLDGAAVPSSERQAAAAKIGFSETVFVDDAAAGEVQIFTPAVEMPFAGHPLVGTAWLLAREREPVEVLRPPAGEVPTRLEGGGALVAGRPEWAHPYRWFELGSPAEVEALAGAPEAHDLAGAYAWAGESTVRARVFPVRLGIEEDEATGGAAVLLGALLGRDIEIRQGRGSVIAVHPREGGLVEIGGRVSLDEVRDFRV
ncbi:MAG: PhzF family phenazine biosynthesis protein [Gammaproteobacteria bacterium]